MDQEVGEDGASLRRLLLLLGLVGCGEAPVGSVEEPKLVSEHYEGLGVFAVQSERFPCDEMLQVMAEAIRFIGILQAVQRITGGQLLNLQQG